MVARLTQPTVHVPGSAWKRNCARVESSFVKKVEMEFCSAHAYFSIVFVAIDPEDPHLFASVLSVIRYRYRLVFPQGVMDNLGMGWNTLSGDEILLAFGRGVGEFELPGLIPLPPSEVEGVEADEQDLLDPSRTSPSSAPHSERTRARALELYEVACRSRAKELQDKKLRPITVHNATGAMQLKVAVFSRTDQLCLLPLTSCVLDPTRRAFLRLDGEEFQLRVYKLDSVLMDRCIYSVAGIRRGQTVNLRSNDCEVVKEGFYTGDQGAGATSGREQDEEVDHLRWK